MANKDDQENFKLNQLLVTSQRELTTELEKGLGVKLKTQLINKEILDISRSIADFAFEELQFKEESSKSLRSESDLLSAQAKVKALDLKTQQQILDLQTKGGDKAKLLSKEEKKRLELLIGQKEQNKGTKDSIDEQIKGRTDLNSKLGIADDVLRAMNNIPILGKFIQSEKVLGVMEATTLATGSALKGMMAGLWKVVQLMMANPLTILFAAVALILKFVIGLASKLNKQITSIQTGTGLTRDAAKDLRDNMAEVANESGKVYMTSQKLVESFNTLTESTGLIANFGGSFLETMTDLTDRLGMSTDEAQQLAYLTNLQGKDGDKILSNQIETVNQFNKQNKIGITAKGIFKDIAKSSATVVVSLGQSVGELTKGALAAKKLGLSMDEIHSAAGGFLDFQSSIQKELEFSLLTNQEVSFAKERQLALDNDLVGLAEALASKESVLNSFRTGNRIEMEAAAAAMNMNSDQLAKIIQQQDYLNMSTAEYSDLYGEQNLKSMQELDAQEKISASIEKMKDRLMVVGEVMLPIIESFAEWVSWISQSKFAMGALVGVMGTLAAASFMVAIAKAWAAAMTLGPIAGPIAAIATTAAIGVAAYNTPSINLPSASEYTPEDEAIQMKDGKISGINIKALPQDSIHIDKSSGDMSIGTNLSGATETNRLLKEQNTKFSNLLQETVKNRPTFRNPTIVFDSFKYSNKNASNGSSSSNKRYKTGFA